MKETFRKNDLPYTLIKRNDLVAMYGVEGTFTDMILHYEVCKIQVRRDIYGCREAIPSNEQFGMEGSSAILNRSEAEQYFDELTDKLKLSSDKAKNTVRGTEKIKSNIRVPLEV